MTIYVWDDDRFSGAGFIQFVIYLSNLQITVRYDGSISCALGEPKVLGRYWKRIYP